MQLLPTYKQIVFIHLAIFQINQNELNTFSNTESQLKLFLLHELWCLLFIQDLIYLRTRTIT